MRREPNLRKNTLRCVHLFILTVFWAVVCLLVVLLLKGERVGLGRFFRYAWNIEIGYIQHLWYLPNFLFLSLMVPVLQALRQSNRKVLTYFIVLIACFYMGNHLLNNIECVLRWILGMGNYAEYQYYFGYVDFFKYNFWYIFVYFALGGYLMEHRERLSKKKWPLVIGILVPMVCIMVTTLAISRLRGYTFDGVYNNYPSIFTLILSACVFLLLINLQPRGLLRKITTSLSTCSLGIYVIHWLVWGTLVRLMPEIMTNMIFAWPMTFVILAISWGITALALKIPVVQDLFTATPQWAKRFMK